jgi:hypothetical protein
MFYLTLISTGERIVKSDDLAHLENILRELDSIDWRIEHD